jgi:hypothetical protein
VHYVPELDLCVRCHAVLAGAQLGERMGTYNFIYTSVGILSLTARHSSWFILYMPSAQTIFFVSVHYVPELDHCVRCHAAHAVIQLGERVCTQIPRCKPYYVFWLLTDAGQEPAYAT